MKNSHPLTHVAVIMDGNRRWAKKHKLEAIKGHEVGAKQIKELCSFATSHGVKCLTVYAFSAQNWNRSQVEVKALTDLLGYFLREENVRQFTERGIVLKFLGEKDAFEASIQDGFERVEVHNRTIQEAVLTLNIALNYGSQEEIVRACRRLVVQNKEITIEGIEENLYTANQPSPELLIRTGGYQRLSNFLLWQMAYTELYFTPVLWPDFSEDDFKAAIEFYHTQERKFGK
jgi:undecaprenyl diphosphate synthase